MNVQILKWIVRCTKCYYLWKTPRDVGNIVTCPMCGAKNKVRILMYLMRREEAKHRKFVKINLAFSILMACFLFWTISLPADLMANIGTFYFLGVTLLFSIMAVSDHFQANAIRHGISKHNHEETQT